MPSVPTIGAGENTPISTAPTALDAMSTKFTSNQETPSMCSGLIARARSAVIAAVTRQALNTTTRSQPVPERNGTALATSVASVAEILRNSLVRASSSACMASAGVTVVGPGSDEDCDLTGASATVGAVGSCSTAVASSRPPATRLDTTRSCCLRTDHVPGFDPLIELLGGQIPGGHRRLLQRGALLVRLLGDGRGLVVAD